MTLREILQALWRRRVLLEVAIAVSALLGLAVVLLQGTEYRAETKVLISQGAVAAEGTTGLLTQQKLNLLAITYGEVVGTPDFVDNALQGARLSRGGASVTGQAVQNTSIVRITVSSASKARTVAVANAVTKGLRDSLEAHQDTLAPNLRTTTVLLERPRASFSSSNPVFTVFAALVAGLAIAVTSALIIELSD